MQNNSCSDRRYWFKPGTFLSLLLGMLLGAMSQVMAQTQQPMQSQISFRVLDQAGNPVMNAVVSTTGPVTKTDSFAVMDQINRQFSPQVLVVQKDQTVNFPNSDAIRHHIYSFSDPKPFEIRLFKGQDSPPIHFDKAGVVVLGCNIHDQMVGYIYIADNEVTGLTDANGMTSLVTTAEQFYVWHPKLSVSNSQRQSFGLSTEPNAIQQVGVTLLTDKAPDHKRTFSTRKFGSGGH